MSDVGRVGDRLAPLFEDHGLLLAGMETPGLWNELLADELDGTGVTDVMVEPVGTGQVASCLRVHLAHEAPRAPGSLVVKTASADPTSRMTSAALRHAEIEVGFYRHMAPAARVRTPQCWVAELSPSGDDFVLVLEDMGEATQGDQIAGMDVAEVASAIDELAALHASWWEPGPPGTPPPAGSAGVGGLPAEVGTFLVDRGDPAAHAALLAMLHPGFADRYSRRLEPEVLELAEALIARAPAYLVDRPGSRAVVHGDFRPDNLLVRDDPDRDGTDERVAVVDWQTVTVGPALADVAYFLGGALVPGDRRAHEAELLERYRAALRGHGVDMSAGEVAEGCRRYALDGLVMAIGASQVVGQTERGDEMFCTMAERAAAHALDADTLALLT